MNFCNNTTQSQRVIYQGLLYTWTSSLGTFFATFVMMKISKNDSNIICRSSKNITFPKIWRVWLKNWACHAHFSYKLLKGMAVSSSERCPSNFGQSQIFYRPSIDILTNFLYLSQKSLNSRKTTFLSPEYPPLGML